MKPLAIARRVAAGDDSGLAEVVELLATEVPETGRTWRLLAESGLLPQAWAGISRARLESKLAPAHVSTLRSMAEASALRNALLRRIALDATRRLDAAGLRVMWVRGMWLAHFVYPSPELRPMRDADLFVPSGGREPGVAVLRDAGYEPNPLVAAADLEVFATDMAPPASVSGGVPDVTIDVHDLLQLSAERIWPVDEIWSRARAVSVGGVEVRIPRLEDGLRLAAIHAFKHGMDLRHLLAAVSDVWAICRRAGLAFDVDLAASRLDDGLDATALYLLLSAAGGAALPGAGPHLYARAADAASRHRTRQTADRLLRSADQPRFVRGSDFSLFAVGEAGFGLGSAVRLLGGSTRWRRRVALDPAAGPRRPLVRRLIDANWQWAWTSFLAGRLSGRLARAAGLGGRPKS